MTRTTLALNGRIVREDGVFVVVVEGTNWTTYAAALDEALNDVPRMVLDILRAYHERGALPEYLGRLGIDKLPDTLDIIIGLDLRDVIPYSIDKTTERVSFPLSNAA
jgi:hypothetical protein